MKYIKNICTLLLCSVLIVVSSACTQQENDTLDSSSNPKGNNLTKVSIGIQVSPAMTLVMVAKDAGFFEKEGLDVEIKEFTAGKFALQAFLGGSIDFAVSGEVPVALASLQKNEIRVVAQVVERTINEVRVVALKDGSISDPSKYFKSKKRKIATSFGGGPEFFTYTFLKELHISDNEIEIISQRPGDMPAALETKSVDAIAIFDPFAFIAESRMGNKVITFSDPELYSELYVLDARPDQIEKKPEVITKILKAFLNAGEYIEKNPIPSKEILKKYTKLSDEIINGVWNNFIFKPALTNKLIEYWNAQAVWAKQTGKVTKGTEIPNFRAIVEDKFLKEVAPKNVRLN